MLKILFISHTSLWGGAEKCLYRLLKGLPREDFRSIVLLPGDGELKTAIESLGIETRQGQILPWVHPWIDQWRGSGVEESVLDIVKLIKQEQVDIVFSNTIVFVHGALAARMCGIPHAWHILEMLSSDPYHKPAIPLHEFYVLLDLLADKLIAASGSVKAEIEQFIASPKIEVIHTVVDGADERRLERRKQLVFGVPEETFVVSFVGDLSERKGVEDLIRCAPAVLAQNPKARFMIAGRDADRSDHVRQQIAQEGLQTAVQLLGFRNDAESILAASDVLVLPTLSDALPLVVQEAMSVGTPVIATRSGGCADMVVHGETGYLVPTRDPGALAASIISLMNSPETCTRMGHLGRKRLSTHFSVDEYIKNMSSIFTQLARVKASSTVSMGTDDLVRILLHIMDTTVANCRLSDKNHQLVEIHGVIERLLNTRLGRTLTWASRRIRSRLGK